MHPLLRRLPVSSMLFFAIVSNSMGFGFAQSASSPALQGPQDRSLTSGPGVLVAANDSGSAAWHAREGSYVKREWGVDIVDVRRVSSGEMLAFRYIVLDPVKAKALNDKQSTAFLVDEKSGAKLQVPQMEKIGALRTSVTPKQGRMYWVVFANTGHVVNVGSKVDVNIGDFHLEGLTVAAR